jgi:hypothetical protein
VGGVPPPTKLVKNATLSPSASGEIGRDSRVHFTAGAFRHVLKTGWNVEANRLLSWVRRPRMSSTKRPASTKRFASLDLESSVGRSLTAGECPGGRALPPRNYRVDHWMMAARIP